MDICMTRTPDFTFNVSDLVPPPCPHFEECGSCQFQHVKPAIYQARKVAEVEDLFRSNGLAPSVWLAPVFIPEGTRRRVTFVAERTGNDVVIGFHAYHTHDIVPIKSCLLLTPRLKSLISELPAELLPLIGRGERVSISLTESDDGALDCVLTGVKERGVRQTADLADFAEKFDFMRISLREKDMDVPQVFITRGSVHKKSGALTVDLPPAAFLQPSREGEEALVEAVMAGLQSKLGSLTKKMKIADFFSGCGTFAGRLLETSQVHAVEGDSAMGTSLAKAAKGNARLTSECRDLFKEPLTTRELKDFSAVVFDPPRAGAKELCQKLAKSNIPIAVGVSCNPATFARDAKILMGGGYRLDTVQIVDQFVWSTHVEIVGVFVKA